MPKKNRTEPTSEKVKVVIVMGSVLVAPANENILRSALTLHESTAAVDAQGVVDVRRHGEFLYEVKNGQLWSSEGLADRIVDRLIQAGKEVAVSSCRAAFDGVGVDLEVANRSAPEDQRLLEIVGSKYRGRIVVPGEDEQVSVVALLHRYFCSGKTLVVVPTRVDVPYWCRRLSRELNELVKELSSRNISDTVRLYVCSPNRFRFGLGVQDGWSQFLYVGKETVTARNTVWGQANLPRGRHYAILRTDEVLSENDALIAEFNAGREVYVSCAEASNDPVLLGFATPPEPRLRLLGLNPHEIKRKVTWENVRRNRYVADVAEALAQSDVDKLFRLGIENEQVLVEVRNGAGAAGEVMILVENDVHAHHLSGLLPSWHVQRGETPLQVEAEEAKNQLDVPGRIVTMAWAERMGLGARVVVRADGTSTPWCDEWEPVTTPGQENRRRIVIDVQDLPVGNERHAERRRRNYEHRGWISSDLGPESRSA